MAHRGRDASGIYSDSFITLAHNRLAILDLSAHGNQPMEYGNLVLILNGEIYNYKELKSELESAGEAFEGSSDTEVLLRALARFGVEATLPRLNGDFAFALYDTHAHRLTLARDRLGNKPLYFHYRGKEIFFASEARVVARVVGAEFDALEVNKNLLFGFGSAHKTLYAGVEALPPAHYLSVDLERGSSELKRYWDWEERVSSQVRRDSLEEALDEFEALLEDSLRLRLCSDVPVALTVSGGLDSSLLASMAYKNGFEAALFGVAFPYDAEACEGKFIQKLADSLAPVHYVYPSVEGVRGDFSDLVKTQGELFRSLSIYAQYTLYRELGKSCKVSISGQGADELFGGYYHHVGRYLYENPRALESRQKLYGVQAESEYRMGEKCHLPKEAKLAALKRDNEANLVRLPFPIPLEWDELLEKFAPSFGEALWGDTFRFTLPFLLRYEDLNAMRFGVENRSPFTDFRVVEFALALPDSWKIAEGYTKYFLRHLAERYIDKELAWRLDKRGFSAPESRWASALGLSESTPFSVRLAIFEELRRNRDLD